MKREEIKRIISRHVIRENKTDDLDEINSYNPVVFVDEDAIVNAILALEQKEQPQPERSAEDLDLIQYVTNLLYYACENSGKIEDFDKWVEEQTSLLDEYRSRGLPEATDEMIESYASNMANPSIPNAFHRGEFIGIKEGAEWMRKQLMGK